jgi:uncharacterized protein (DUF433 family)
VGRAGLWRIVLQIAARVIQGYPQISQMFTDKGNIVASYPSLSTNDIRAAVAYAADQRTR